MASSIYKFLIYFWNFISIKSRKQFCISMFHLIILFEKAPKQTFSSYKVAPCMKLSEASFKDPHPNPSPQKKRKKTNLLHSLSMGIHSCSGVTGVHCSLSHKSTLALPSLGSAFPYQSLCPLSSPSKTF